MTRSTALVIRDYLQAGSLLQLATVDAAHQPRIVHVWYAVDERLCLYFASSVTRNHSDDIRRRSVVAGGIISTPLLGFLQSVRGVMFRGRASELSETNEIARGFAVFERRWPQVSTVANSQQLLAKSTPIRLYKVEPSEYILYDEENYPGQPKQVLERW